MQHYSLLHRFQGALVGASVLNCSRFSPLNQLRHDLGDRLLSQDTLSPTDGKNFYHLYQARLIFPLSSSELILATLPLQLRYYDAPSRLLRQLENLTLPWQQAATNLEDVLVWSHYLGEVFGGNLSFLACPRLLLGRNTLVRDLHELDAYLAKSLPLHQILNFAANKPHSSILSALACFLPTPEASPLCLAKARRISPDSELILSLTGVLCGAYNSIWDLPRTESPELETQAQGIFSRWLGMTQVSNYALTMQQPLGRAGSLQRRAGFQIVSQRS